MAQYLKSLITGVVLPYNVAALKSADIRLMDPAECAEYEASMGVGPSLSSNVEQTATTEAVDVEPTVTVEAGPTFEEPVSVEVEIEDLDPVEEVLGALETE